MGSQQLRQAECWIDGAGPGTAVLHLEQDFRTEQFLVVADPDSSWTHTDAAGHFHAYTVKGKLPTLTESRREVPCDGSCSDRGGCEGYSATEYHCRICQAVAEPGRVVQHNVTRSFPGRASWRVEAGGVLEVVAGGQVSVRIRAGGHEWFGVGVVTRVDFDSDTGARVTVIGNGELGERKAPARPRVPVSA